MDGASLLQSYRNLNLAKMFAELDILNLFRLSGFSIVSINLAVIVEKIQQFLMPVACGMAIVFFLTSIMEDVSHDIGSITPERILKPFIKLIISLIIVSNINVIGNSIAQVSDILTNVGIEMIGDSSGDTTLEAIKNPNNTNLNFDTADNFAASWLEARAGDGYATCINADGSRTGHLTQSTVSCTTGISSFISVVGVKFLIGVIDLLYHFLCVVVFFKLIKRMLEFYIRISLLPLAATGLCMNGTHSQGFSFILETLGVGIKGLVYCLVIVIGLTLTSSFIQAGLSFAAFFMFFSIAAIMASIDSVVAKLIG